MSRDWIIPIAVILVIIGLLSFNIAKLPPPKDDCPHYLTVETVSTEYRGAWTGNVTTVTTTDGGRYKPGKDDFYVGQKVCVNKL